MVNSKLCDGIMCPHTSTNSNGANTMRGTVAELDPGEPI